MKHLKMQKIFFLVAVLLTGIAFPGWTQKNKLAVIAYYAGRPEALDNYEIDKLTHLIYCFGHLRGNELFIGNGAVTVNKMISFKEKNPDLKVLLSLGGWGGCATCSDVFSTDSGRTEFAHSVKSILSDLKADGIDLDWEYPVVSGYPGHSRSPEDKKNFTSLMKTLRDTLGKKAIISFAAGGYQDYLDSAIEWRKVMRYVDFVNLMTYDLVNGYSTVTGHHTALYSSGDEMESADRAVRYLLHKKIPAKKLVIGAAFYGRIWRDVPDSMHGLYQSGKFMHGVSYKNIDSLFTTSLGYTQHWDSTVNAPYAYNADSSFFLTYDDKRSIRLKTRYALMKKLGGIMFWQLGDDKPKDGLLSEIIEVKENHKSSLKNQ